MWQTDFTQFLVIDWGWYYLSTVLDDYSRYILAYKLSPTMNAQDAEDTLLIALAEAEIDKVKVYHKPRLLSDNGPAYHSKDLATFLKERRIIHIHSSPYHPMTQGKIERWHRSMKNVVKLQNYYCPSELESAIAQWVAYYNNQSYHEALENVTPADVYFGRDQEIIEKRTSSKNKPWLYAASSICRLRGYNLISEAKSLHYRIDLCVQKPLNRYSYNLQI